MFDSFASRSRFDLIGDWYDRVSGLDRWIETEATIDSCIWQEGDEGDGWFYNVYVYQVEEQYYVGHFNSATEFLRGEQISVRYHPRDPRRKYASSFRGGREPLVLAVIAIFCFAFWLVLHALS